VVACTRRVHFFLELVKTVEELLEGSECVAVDEVVLEVIFRGSRPSLSTMGAVGANGSADSCNVRRRQDSADST